MLIVSTLTQACLNFDPRRAGGTQVLLFSCGGRADGGGLVTNSQLFAFNGSAGPLLLKPNNQAGSCLVEKANAVDIANCNATDPSQLFTFGDGASAVTSNHFSTRPSLATAVGTTVTAHDTPTSLPAGAVPVSRGGQLSPTAAAEAQQRDDTAVRAFNNVSVRAPNGQCLFADPTAGDFRKNLIPVGLVECAGSPNEKWDIITQGTHNDQPSSALVVSSLVTFHAPFDLGGENPLTLLSRTDTGMYQLRWSERGKRHCHHLFLWRPRGRLREDAGRSAVFVCWGAQLRARTCGREERDLHSPGRREAGLRGMSGRRRFTFFHIPMIVSTKSGGSSPEPKEDSIDQPEDKDWCRDSACRTHLKVAGAKEHLLIGI